MARQRMVLEVIHLDHANVSKMELKERLSKMYKVKDRNTIFVFKFRTGSISSGLIYDNLDSKKFEPKYCLIWARAMTPESEVKCHTTVFSGWFTEPPSRCVVLKYGNGLIIVAIFVLKLASVKEKSLGLLTQNFVKLFFTMEVETISL
ncbi:40S ribosomal protein S24-2 [Zea mays]|nr:40S ribosomal protein S24-2 [Zea mays]